VLLVIVVSAIFDVIIGSIIGPTTDVAVASGFSGFSGKLIFYPNVTALLLYKQVFYIL